MATESLKATKLVFVDFFSATSILLVFDSSKTSLETTITSVSNLELVIVCFVVVNSFTKSEETTMTSFSNLIFFTWNFSEETQLPLDAPQEIKDTAAKLKTNKYANFFISLSFRLLKLQGTISILT